ncbi:phospholipase C, phosphocholine-specific [Gallaecimonas kandeliae]|uniref:phosphocholine-specific phospholipase C n=1 Tax=Gallaecimonas kandeliae TaxID=3029055 RepID=UPI002647B35B|nr:phospholipase C, phosphocholine-specific [Gallaecimonas kandeliae]WKE65008.1 phospholipase C, phosphocholine-specific [Gallaecimonas kandeliae]
MVDLQRRRFLQLSSATAAGIAASAMLPATIRKALAIEPARVTGTIQDVKHVVIFMQENRSFDHYFGSLRGVRGFDDPRAMQSRPGLSVWQQVCSKTPAPVLPFHLDSQGTSAQTMHDLNHDWRGPVDAWACNDVWAEQKTPMTMGYFKRDDMPFYYALADAFTICDGYHCSLFGPTNPNRMYLWTGTSGLSVGNNGEQVVANKDDGNWTSDMGRDHGDFAPYDWTTYPERLDRAGVSWKVYQEYDNFGDNALQSFKAFRGLDPASKRYQQSRAWVSGSSADNAAASRGEHLVAAFKKDVENGTLPEVSWLIAPYILSEHPQASPGYGASLTARLLEALMSNPEVWSKTVFLLNYDENGGFFDHIPVPVPPVTAAIGKSNVPLDGENYHGEPLGLGPRVPMMVISPWSRGGWVNSQLFDHTSVLRFLEQRFGVKEPNISPWRRAVAGDLTSTLDFAGTDATWPKLPDTSHYIGQVDNAAKLDAPVVPPMAAMPRQEPGQRPARPLPYDMEASAWARNGKLALSIDNRSNVAVALGLYDNQAAKAPRHYTAAAHSRLDDKLDAGQSYQLSLHGPNGYLRHFAGSGDDPLVVTLSRGTTANLVMLTLRNVSGAPQQCRITDGYSKEVHQCHLAPGQQKSLSWHIADQAHWYDLTLTQPEGPYRRRWCGHQETGKPSFSDPLIGAA